MRSKLRATSGPVFSLYLSFVLLVVLISVSDKAYAKRGCASFGHSCFGGHGKRFDSAMRHETLQESGSQRFQESNVPSPNDDNELFYVLPNDEFRERSDRSLPFTRTRKDTQQFDPYPLSSLLNQWIASHRRPHRTETDISNK
ncbi:neuropeptide CCHamide-2 isoform X4 [Cataglyphis hispanica]|uniref:neuropeptide CCHamide-2 isoform X4 n=1 Tax=Cataglyphis hispanica TaxID=1086592 RepID=UPI00217FF54D|nr:neuropeptide CCHamide-2 isoform X4 [Cataglyphis hispanica]